MLAAFEANNKSTCLPDLLRLEQLGEVGHGHLGLGQVPVLLLLCGLPPGAVEGVQPLEGGLGPDDEPAEVAAGGELEEVESLDGDGVAAGDVAEGAGDALVVVVDDEGAELLDAAAVAHLAAAGAHALGLVDLGEKDVVSFAVNKEE